MNAPSGVCESGPDHDAGQAEPTGAHQPVMADPDLSLYLDWPTDEEHPERFAGWDVAQWCRVGVYEDEHGLHLTVSTRDKDYTRAVTAEQVERFASHLRMLVAATAEPG